MRGPRQTRSFPPGVLANCREKQSDLPEKRSDGKTCQKAPGLNPPWGPVPFSRPMADHSIQKKECAHYERALCV